MSIGSVNMTGSGPLPRHGSTFGRRVLASGFAGFILAFRAALIVRFLVEIPNPDAFSSVLWFLYRHMYFLATGLVAGLGAAAGWVVSGILLNCPYREDMLERKNLLWVALGGIGGAYAVVFVDTMASTVLDIVALVVLLEGWLFLHPAFVGAYVASTIVVCIIIEKRIEAIAANIASQRAQRPSTPSGGQRDAGEGPVWTFTDSLQSVFAGGLGALIVTAIIVAIVT